MTKVSVFGQQPTETKELKKIEFVNYIDGSSINSNCMNKPCYYEEVILISKDYFLSGKDLILAKDILGVTIVYLGHWNDGVV